MTIVTDHLRHFGRKPPQADGYQFCEYFTLRGAEKYLSSRVRVTSADASIGNWRSRLFNTPNAINLYSGELESA
jgi:hypothetical protein